MQLSTAGRTVAVEGEPAPQLSRWLWLVKWFLAIPHYVVLSSSGSHRRRPRKTAVVILAPRDRAAFPDAQSVATKHLG